ncbi:MAG: helix-turn-helix transcriptional regulator [Pirellulales bacterium]|nr:helix-turn-helix transcriptional regulator [Planctomycetales bacterium]
MANPVDQLCIDAGITLDELVERSGLDYNRVAAIVGGRWTPKPEERQKIAAVFDLEPSDIAWGHKTPIQHIYGHGPG